MILETAVSRFKGACVRLALHADSERKQVFDEHCLPAPLYREYFVDYVATCFDSAMDYLRAMRARRDDPAHVMSALPEEALLRVFELRVYAGDIGEVASPRLAVELLLGDEGHGAHHRLVLGISYTRGNEILRGLRLEASLRNRKDEVLQGALVSPVRIARLTRRSSIESLWSARSTGDSGLPVWSGFLNCP